jgi:hypothetical protein
MDNPNAVGTPHKRVHAAIATLRDLDHVLARHRDRYVEVLRESLARKLDHANDDAEAAQDYCRKLIREGADITEDLKELECLGNAVLLVALMLRREAKGSE